MFALKLLEFAWKRCQISFNSFPASKAVGPSPKTSSLYFPQRTFILKSLLLLHVCISQFSPWCCRKLPGKSSYFKIFLRLWGKTPQTPFQMCPHFSQGNYGLLVVCRINTTANSRPSHFGICTSGHPTPTPHLQARKMSSYATVYWQTAVQGPRTVRRPCT